MSKYSHFSNYMKILFLSLLPLLFACSPNPPPMSENTQNPPGVEVTRIEESKTTHSEITQTKIFDQCESLSPIKAQISFGEMSEKGVQEELVLGANLGGEIGVSSMAKITLEGSIENHFSSTEKRGQTHQEFVSIEVPSKSHQEYSIVWRETRRDGKIYYKENGVDKSIDFSYRIGLELISTHVKDLYCQTDTADLQPTPTQTLTSETPTEKPEETVLIEPTPQPRITKFATCLQPCNGTNSTKVFPEGIRKIYASWNYKNIPVGAHYVRYWAMEGREWVRYDCYWPGPDSGHSEVELSEPDGLHSGTWTVSIIVNDEVLLSENIKVEGNWDYWYPVGVINSCFGTIPDQDNTP